MSAQPLILVAEDNPVDQSLLQRAIEKAALQVRLEFVKDGLEAVRHLENTPAPALLMLDLKMPEMGGFEVLEWLQQHSQLRPGYIVILSSSCLGTDLQRASALGVDHYLVKPGDPSELVAILKRLEPYWAGRPMARSAPTVLEPARLGSAA